MPNAAPKAPIALFAFNRPGVLVRVLEKLSRCDDLDGGGVRKAFVFVDAPRDGRNEEERVEQVVSILRDFKRLHLPSLEIVRRDANFGLRRNIMDGVSSVLSTQGRAIVMEDDFLVGRFFLRYMDAALERYSDDGRIWCINAGRPRYVRVPMSYGEDVYLSSRNVCGDWSVWKDRWDAVDFDLRDWLEFKKGAGNLEKIDSVGIDVKEMLDAQYRGELNSWAVACTYHMVKNGMFAVEPRLALVKHIGYGDDSVHCGELDVVVSTAKYYDFMPHFPDRIVPDLRILSQLRYMAKCPLLAERIRRKILRTIWRIGPRHDEPIAVK